MVVTISEAASSDEGAFERGFGLRRDDLEEAREAAVMVLEPAAAAAAPPEDAPEALEVACPEVCCLPLTFRCCCDEDDAVAVDDEDDGPALEAAAGVGRCCCCCCCSPGSRPFAAALRWAFAAFAAAFASLPDGLAASPAVDDLGSDMIFCVTVKGRPWDLLGRILKVSQGSHLCILVTERVTSAPSA